MRTHRSLPVTRGLGSVLRRVGQAACEVLLLGGALALVETAGRFSENDGTDLLVVFGVLLLGALLAQAARAGCMPRTHAFGLGAWRRLRAFGRNLSPRYAVAFRRTPDARSRPDRTLAVPTLALLGALTLLTAAGPYLLDGLLVLKRSVAYTAYLACLALVWAVLFLTVICGCVAAAQWLQRIAQRRGDPILPLALFGLGWVAGLVALSFLPGWVALGFVLIAGWLTGRSLNGLPMQSYLFCRRDGAGQTRTIPVQDYLRQTHTLLVLALAVAVVLGQTQRLWFAAWPTAPFSFTSWLGLLASLCAGLLVVRAGAHFRRIVGGGEVPPEVPLTPTLWLKRSPIREEGGPEEQQERFWYETAREGGWLVLRGDTEPVHDYDLVLGDPTSPRRFSPREPQSDEDARFQLARRFHIAMRRRFRRSFERLFKQLRRETPTEGTGYLFCPHVWLVPGVVRDVDLRDRRGSSGSLSSPSFHGPPYQRAFHARERRYIGTVLRDLQIDIIYFEDAITWKDIRRVLTVAYEIHDQRRGPLQDRHFMGLPRVRVVIQEEAAEAEPPPTVPAAGAGSLPEEAAGHARILLILRDRGQRDEEVAPDPADTGIRTPSLVG